MADKARVSDDGLEHQLSVQDTVYDNEVVHPQ